MPRHQFCHREWDYFIHFKTRYSTFLFSVPLFVCSCAPSFLFHIYIYNHLCLLQSLLLRNKLNTLSLYIFNPYKAYDAYDDWLADGIKKINILILFLHIVKCHLERTLTSGFRIYLTKTCILHQLQHNSVVCCFTITMTSQWAWWRLRSPTSRLFTQSSIRAQIKENIKSSRHWRLCGEITGDRWIPRTNGH